MRDSDNFSQELQSVFWDRVLRKNPLQKKRFVSPFRPRGGTEKVQAPPQLSPEMPGCLGWGSGDGLCSRDLGDSA